jgi:glyoxylase-like metal-dependent hydrolase (beta-lactamase superfamily II)
MSHSDKPASWSRRDALKVGALAGAGALAQLADPGRAHALFAQTPVAPAVRPNESFPAVPSWETELRELAPNVYGYVQAGGPGRDNVSVSDAGMIIGDDGVMVIDTLTAPIHAANFIASIRKVTDKPFRHVINTHHHSDHVNGNQYFMPAEIIGHPYCREEVLKMIPGPATWPRREGWATGTEPRRIFAPTTTFEEKMTLHYGKTVVDLIFMGPAHTFGDIAVYLPQHKILFAGDIAFYYVAPFAQNAHVTRWLSTIDRIMAMEVDTIVPGHGPIGGKQELANMKGYFVLLKQEARRRYDARMSPGRAAADISLGKYDNWIGPERIVMDTVRLYAEFAGTLVPAMDVEGTRRATEEYNAIKSSRP